MSAARPTAAPAPGWLRREVRQWRGFHRDEGAQIVFIGIFGCIAYTMLLGFLLNNAVNIQEKLRMQNAADAATLAAAQAVARGLNQISDNNVAVSEYIAIQSLSQGIYAMGCQVYQEAQKVMQQAWAQYLAAVESGNVQAAAEALKLYWTANLVSNTAMTQIIMRGSYFQVAVPGNANRRINQLNQISADLVSGLPGEANQRMSEMAVAQNGAAQAATCNPTLAVRIMSAGGWSSPVKTGSPRPAIGPAGSPVIMDAGRRGYHYVYAVRGQPRYELGKGPFPTFLEELLQAPILTTLDLLQALGISGSEILRQKSSQFVGVASNSYQGPFELAGGADPEQMTVLGVVRGNPWPALMFSGASRDLRPFSRRLGGFDQPQRLGTIAMAEAQIFNPVSWDLFTQYWDVQLTRIKKIPDVTQTVEGFHPIIENTMLYH